LDRFGDMNAFPRSSLFAAVILTTFVQTGVGAQRRSKEPASAAPESPEALVSAAKAFRSKPSGQRLGEGWRLLPLIRTNPFEEASKGVTNFWFGPLASSLFRTNLASFLGPPDLVYTNTFTGTNTVCYVYTCGWDPEGACIEFRIDFIEPPMVWLNQNSIISAAESARYRQEVLPRFKPHYDKIIAALRAGELEPDAAGRLQVPAIFPVVTMAREAYVSRQATGLMIGFKLWSGRKSNMEGYLYSDARLADTQIGQYPKLWIGPLLVAVERKIDDHWYVIAYRID
jgi:hypothetical protein